MGAARIVATLVVALAVCAATPTAGTAGDRGVLVPTVATPWPGKIFVAHDEWVFSDHGLAQAPTARTLALNVAAWFTGGRPGRFLVHSEVARLTGEGLAGVMRGAGHTWTVDAVTDLTLETLLEYDAVFLAGTEVDNALLIDYVRAGGGVFLQGGTGLGGDVFEAAHWNTFLNAFGLRFESLYNRARTPGVYPVQSTSPLFKGVTSLYEEIGNPISRIDPADGNVQILVASDEGQGLYATYAGGAIAVEVEIAPSRINVVSRGTVTLGIPGAAGLDVRAIDPGSLRILGVRPRHLQHDYALRPGAWPLIGRTRLRPGPVGRPDRHLDLIAKFDGGEIVRAVERTLGRPLADGEVVALTVTGRLRPQLGGHPIVGEDLVQVFRPRGR